MRGEASASNAPVIGVLTTMGSRRRRAVLLPIVASVRTRICVASDGLGINSIAVLVMNSKLCLKDILVRSNGHGCMICEARWW
jgi:hypothetical protein